MNLEDYICILNTYHDYPPCFMGDYFLLYFVCAKKTTEDYKMQRLFYHKKYEIKDTAFEQYPF